MNEVVEFSGILDEGERRAEPVKHLRLFADLIEHLCARVTGDVVRNGERADRRAYNSL